MNIKIDQLSFSYPSGVEALRDLSLGIKSGESVAIIGENGAGKTTLVKHFNGLLRPRRGTVTVGEWDTRRHSVAEMAARVGHVFQNPDDQLFQQTVRAEVMFGPRNLGWGMDRVRAQAEAALSWVGLIEAADRHPYDLSAGDRKRVALASVLSMDTPVVVLDEPTTGQDHRGVETIGQIVDGLRERGRTVITISHDIDFCAEHFERVVVMAGGRVLMDGSSRDVFARPAVLAQTDVEPPQLARLAARLGMAAVPLNLEEFSREIDRWWLVPSDR